jgi:drug/metabolite transporter (DMT)-like permease
MDRTCRKGLGGMRRSKVFGLAAVALWSSAAAAFKLTLRVCTPLQLVLGSSAVSLLFLAAYCLFRDGRLPASRSLIAGGAVRGLINPFVYYLVLINAYSLLPAQIAMVINYLWPLMLVLLSVPLLGRRLRLRNAAGMAVSFGGVAVLAFAGNPAGGSGPAVGGILLALLSTVLWALYWLLNMRDRCEPVARLFWNFAWGVAYLLAWGIATGEAGLPADLSSAAAGCAWTGLFEMGLTYVIWMKALSLAESPAEVGGLVYLTPFASLAWIALLTGEGIGIATLAGLALVLSGLRLGRGEEG